MLSSSHVNNKGAWMLGGVKLERVKVQKAAVHLLTSPYILVFSRNTGLKRRCVKRKALSSRR